MNAAYDERVSGERRWFWFAYLVPGRTGRELRMDRVRDAVAAMYLQPVLSARGLRFAGTILNLPATGQSAGTGIAMDHSFLRPGDLLVLTTRPPLDDLVDGDRHRVDRSHTALEIKVFACIRRHLSHCSRSKVTVSDMHARASADVARMANVQFRQKLGAAIDAIAMYDSGRWQSADADSRTSLAYLIHEERAWENGPAVLASFGMCGTDTLAWNYLLATQYSALVAAVPFAMAEITAPTPPVRPHTVDFACDWKARLMTSEARAAP